jgi:hypothetical protein
MMRCIVLVTSNTARVNVFPVFSGFAAGMFAAGIVRVTGDYRQPTTEAGYRTSPRGWPTAELFMMGSLWRRLVSGI